LILNTIRKKVAARRPANLEESGNDIVVTLFMLPIVLGVIFSGIEVSTYFQARAEVQNITRDGARQVALYGGTSESIVLNQTGKNITQTVYNRLYTNGHCTVSACAKAPTVTCGPSKATSLNDDAYCTVEYFYQNMGLALVEWLGYDKIVNNPIKITEQFKVETRY
jgi:Flp pilus assembly protein TadG